MLTVIDRPVGQGRSSAFHAKSLINGQLVGFVAKPHNVAGLPHSSPYAEVLGASLAQRMGILAPLTVFAEVPPPLVDTVKRICPLWNAESVLTASRRVDDIHPLNANVLDLATRDEDAFKILLFDLIARNPDRMVENPNLFVQKGRMWTFDFGDCWSELFVPLIGGAQDPWQTPFENHAVRPLLKGKPILDKWIDDAIDGANGWIFDANERRMPSTFEGEIPRRIVSDVEESLRHGSDIVAHLKRGLL